MILLGLANLRRTGLRTFLTILGVIIGIGALTSMVSFGTGMQKNVTDAIIISKYADVMIFVIRQNYTDKHALRFINSLYEQKKLPNLSLLINDIKIPQYVANYNYAYGYGYKNGAGYYEE